MFKWFKRKYSTGKVMRDSVGLVGKSDVKLCQDCKHFQSSSYGIQVSRCMHKKLATEAVKYDAVLYVNSPREIKEREPAFCYVARVYGACGPKGMLFEPKENV